MKVGPVKEFEAPPQLVWDVLMSEADRQGAGRRRVFQPIVNQEVTNVLDALEAEVAEAKWSSP